MTGELHADKNCFTFFKGKALRLPCTVLGELPAPYVQAFFHEFVQNLLPLGSYWGNGCGFNP
jgi:hypothetical protein